MEAKKLILMLGVVRFAGCAHVSLRRAASTHVVLHTVDFCNPATTELVEARPSLVFLHGIFGAGRNFRTLSQQCLAATGTQFRGAMCVDLRNHGHSARSHDMSYEAMADDVAHLLRQTPPHAGHTLVGHSMGGKVAMALALAHPTLVRRLVVADIAPVPYAATMRESAHVLAALVALPLAGLVDRRDADAQLQAAIPNATVRAFVLQNLLVPRTPGTPASWQVNLSALVASMPALADFSPALVAGRAYHGPTLFIRGGVSPFVRPADPAHSVAMHRLFPHHRMVTIPEVGHWVHAENPSAFIEAVKQFVMGNSKQ